MWPLRNARSFASQKGQRRSSRPQLLVEALEDRLVPSTLSSIAANFNPTAIPAGDTLWFNAAFKATGLGSAPVTLHITNGFVSFAANSTSYNLAVPDATITFTPGATTATTNFDAASNTWVTNVSSNVAGNVFLAGVALPVASSLPGGIHAVTWQAAFQSDTAGVSVSWQWAAAVYKNFGTDYTTLGVKPVDAKNLSVYPNGDHAGTPEAFKAQVTAGALGGGGTNYTGAYTPATNVTPSSSGTIDYPFPSSNPLTSVAFNESEVLAGAKLDVANGTFEVWYTDEHALALGVRQVNVITASGTSTTNYPVTALTSNPSAALNPALGTTATTGDQAGTDLSGRPISPSLYITDITTDPNSRSGDWQYGGTAIAPSAVFGTWKAFVRTVDHTKSPTTVTVTGDADPAKNGWNLGAGSDTPPAGLTNAGYGAEVRWNLNDLYSQGLLIPGHNYRFYVIVHDGDQNKTGGDAGQASFNYNYPGAPPASLSGVVYVDGDADQTGVLDSSDTGLAGVTLLLQGTDAQGHQVSLTTTTDANGAYSFTNLQPGTYSIVEMPPGSPYLDGVDTLGSLGGIVGTDIFSQIYLQGGQNGTNYNFSELFSLPPIS
jgi:hypothetical protein